MLSYRFYHTWPNICVFCIEISFFSAAYINLTYLSPYLYDYKTGGKIEFFTSKNNTKNLGLSYKMDLEFCDCFEGEKIL